MKENHDLGEYVKSRDIYTPKDYIQEYKRYVSYAMIRSEFIFDSVVISRFMEYFFNIDSVKNDPIYHEGTNQELDEVKFREKYLCNFQIF